MRRNWLFLLLALSGCGHFFVRLTTRYAETGWSAARAARWDGPECKRAVATTDEVTEASIEGGYYERSGAYDPEKIPSDPSPEAQILLAVCKRSRIDDTRGYSQWPKIRPLDPLEHYFSADDRNVDPLTAAIAAVHVSSSPRRTDGHGLRESVAVALLWTRIFSPERIELELRKVALPDGAKGAFLAQYRAVPARLEPLIEPGPRAVLVELAADVYRRRQQHYEDHALLYQKYDRLVEKVAVAREVPADRDRVALALEKLRSDFLAKCGRAECRALPLYGLVTKELAKLHALRRDLLAATAESWLISRPGTWVAGLAQAVYVEQLRETRRLGEIRTKYDRAMGSGMDARAAAELAGGTPVDVRGIITPSTQLADYARALEGADRVKIESGVVASASGGGEQRKVLFKKERHENSVPYDCRRTSRISHIGREGTITYEEDCKWRDVTDVVETHAPLQVPAAEAARLRAGDAITFVNLEGTGLILEVKRGDRIVQLRGDRVK